MITRVLIALQREVEVPLRAHHGHYRRSRHDEGASSMEGILILLVLVTAATMAWIVPEGKVKRYHIDDKEFSCRLELVGGVVPGLRIGHTRRARAAWCHTALLLRRRGPWAESWALGVYFPTGALERVGAGVRRRHRGDEVSLTLQLDDGSRVRVLAHQRDADLLVGPFLAAAVEYRDRDSGQPNRRN